MLSDNSTVSPNSTGLPPCPMDSNGQQRLAKLIAISILLFVSLIGNLLVCVIVYRKKNMRTTINYLLVNMSISDLTVPLLVVTRKIVEISTNNAAWRVKGVLGSLVCKAVYFLSDISPIVSILSLLMISYDRFAAILLPHKAANYPSKYRKYFIGLTWSLAFISCSPYFYFLGLESRDGSIYCTMLWDDSTRRGYTVPLTFLFIIIPFLLLVAMYSCILYKIKTQPSNVNQTERGKRRSKASKRNTTLLSFTVVLTFAICWGPYFTILMLSNFEWNWEYDYCTYKDFIFTVQFLAYSNAAINPFFYFLFLRNFRSGLESLCLPLKAFGKDRSTNKQDQMEEMGSLFKDRSRILTSHV